MQERMARVPRRESYLHDWQVAAREYYAANGVRQFCARYHKLGRSALAYVSALAFVPVAAGESGSK